MGDIDLNAQGDINIGGNVAGRDIITTNITNIEAAAPLALNLHQLPPPPRDFTGRTAELTELMAAVETGGVTISGLHGLGGIGKTALALKLAAQLAEHYPDAQFYLDLKGVSDKPLSPADAMAHVIRAYHPISKLPENEAELHGLYQSVLHGQCALLLLDNARDAAQVASLLPPSGCIAIITSRQHFALASLYPVNLEKLPPDDAKNLIERIVVRLSAKQLANALNEMAQLCGYLPLALRASASALQERIDLSPTDYVRRLRDESKRLQLEGIKAEGVPISVAASFNLSYQLLTEEQQRLWRALAVFPDSFVRAAAAAAWELEIYPAQDALSELVKYSLLDYLPSPAGRGAGGEAELPGRYRLHDLARLFAAAHLSEAERYEAQKRHAAHYKNVLWIANDLYIRGADSNKVGSQLLDAEWSNIQAGQAWATNNLAGDKAAAQLCNDYADSPYVLSVRQHPHDWIRWLKAALASAQSLKRSDAEIVHFGNLGNAYLSLGKLQEAAESYQQVIFLSQRNNDRQSESNALMNMGIILNDLKQQSKAIELLEHTLTIYQEIGDRIGEGNALGNIGVVYRDQGEPLKAIEFHERHLIISRAIGYRQGESTALTNIGLAFATLNENETAIIFYHQALAVIREINYPRGEGDVLWKLSLALDKLGDRTQAIAHAEAALKIYEQIESPHTETVRKQLEEWRQRIDIG